MRFNPPPPWVLDRRRAIGDNVRSAREARQLTQEQLAERAGLDRKTINRVEQATHATNIDRLLRVAHALDIPLADLVR